MDILIPLLLGVGINLIIYTIGIFLIKNRRSCHISLYLTTISTVFLSLLIGGFTGIGIFVISLGMLLVAITFSLITLFTKNTIIKEAT